MNSIDDINNQMYAECSKKWLEMYNLLSGKNYDFKDISFINDFTSINPDEGWKMEILKNGVITLIKHSFIFADDTEEMKIKVKLELESLKEELSKIEK